VALFDEEHEDSVYGLAWSAADPWLLASMSYDGRVVVSAVPKGLKYKILI
jgi:WD40 repeat protein